MTFQYQQQLTQVRDQPCPCTEKFIPRNVTAYRFMNNLATADDFIPPAIKDGVGPGTKCSSYALSFFSSLDSARRRYLELSKKFDASSRYGTHIAIVDIVEADGVCEDFKNNHMDLHPEANIIFHNRARDYQPAKLPQATGAVDAP